MDNIVSLNNLDAIESFSARFARLGDLYVLFNIDTGKPDLKSLTYKSGDETIQNTVGLPGLNRPFRLNGMLLLLIHRGSISLQVNSSGFKAKQSDVFVLQPGSLAVFNDIEADSAFTVLFISTTFLNTINIDWHALELRPLLAYRKPVLTLNFTQSQIFHKYLDILDYNATESEETVFAPHVARTLISSIVYEILRFARILQKDKENVDNTSVSELNRSQNYVFRFLQLLHMHCAKQRNLKFYSDSLCISSKYLSLITKQLTGKTAAYWINRHVIQEAKNLLLFSDKNIQQVAYTMNFPSQSAFGKYFKRFTGKSPGEFIRIRQN